MTMRIGWALALIGGALCGAVVAERITRRLLRQRARPIVVWRSDP
jgi:hypothetical protein